jgi:hypothetical protein
MASHPGNAAAWHDSSAVSDAKSVLGGASYGTTSLRRWEKSVTGRSTRGEAGVAVRTTCLLVSSMLDDDTMTDSTLGSHNTDTERLTTHTPTGTRWLWWCSHLSNSRHPRRDFAVFSTAPFSCTFCTPTSSHSSLISGHLPRVSLVYISVFLLFSIGVGGRSHIPDCRRLACHRQVYQVFPY